MSFASAIREASGLGNVGLRELSFTCHTRAIDMAGFSSQINKNSKKNGDKDAGHDAADCSGRA